MIVRMRILTETTTEQEPSKPTQLIIFFQKTQTTTNKQQTDNNRVGTCKCLIILVRIITDEREPGNRMQQWEFCIRPGRNHAPHKINTQL